MKAIQIKWQETPDSTNIMAIGWDKAGRVYIRFSGDRIYMYPEMSRQRAVAALRSKSVGRYFNKKIKPHYESVQVT
jgi:KTSC domain